MILRFWNDLSTTTRSLAILGMIFMVIGKLFVITKLYFFWESFHIGYMLVLGTIGVALLPELLIRIRILGIKTKRVWRIVLRTLFVVLTIGIQSLFLLSSSWKTIREELRVNKDISSEVGSVEGFGWFISGSSSEITDSSGSHEYAIYNVLIKGSKKYKEVTISAERHNEEAWEIKVLE